MHDDEAEHVDRLRRMASFRRRKLAEHGREDNDRNHFARLELAAIEWALRVILEN